MVRLINLFLKLFFYLKLKKLESFYSQKINFVRQGEYSLNIIGPKENFNIHLTSHLKSGGFVDCSGKVKIGRYFHTGKNLNIFFSNELINILEQSKDIKNEFNDKFISPEILLYSIIVLNPLSLQNIIEEFNLNAIEFKKIILKIRNGKTIRLVRCRNKLKVPLFCHIIMMKKPLIKKNKDILNP